MAFNRLTFNVGGKKFETTTTTLAVAGPDSFFGARFVRPDWGNAIFIDRDPECFSVLLNLLRTGQLHVPSNVPKDLLLKEAQFYGVLDLVRAATSHPLDGNRLSLLTSVTIPTTDEFANVIRARPTGGCCVSHGRTVRVYDWMLTEHSPIILDYGLVTDIAWLDSDNIVVTAPEGMRLFNVSTGEQTLEMHVTTQEECSAFSFWSLCVDNDHKIYSGCYQKGLGVWDGERSEPIDFFHQTWLGKVDKLQWLTGSKSLLVGSYNLKCSNNIDCLTLLDFRLKKKLVWDWYGRCGAPSNSNDIVLKDMAVMETRNAIFGVDDRGKLGFIDLRFNPAWSGSNDYWNFSASYDYNKRVSLIENDGQLFYSNGNQIWIYSGRPEPNLTSKIHTDNYQTSEIIDLSIADDRLFSLRKEGIFDVWETRPRSPIL